MALEERKQALEEYALLAKKHSLPDAEVFESELGVSLDKSPALPFFLRCVHERISNSVAHLEIVLHPSRMADMIETKFHSEEDKKKIFEFYKSAMVVLHEIILAVFTSVDEEISCLKSSWKFYNDELKIFMQEFLKAQINGWKEEVTEEIVGRNYVR